MPDCLRTVTLLTSSHKVNSAFLYTPLNWWCSCLRKLSTDDRVGSAWTIRCGRGRFTPRNFFHMNMTIVLSHDM
ncbi:uncharacterized protein BO87DRAFT_1506 [Aspergillus neoniger CBS 115656]|uniref:Uncharacterized protein n=1 Tax=Aspergillus neoniger (strain CBS 115656) TaxID=1448310 RepID=A0A318YZC1_ASPNB|nr:hypothetical protein BO87DRAFT_1506 [Aspergillus neoniger CBS 115656]PYH39534.1 hypothetical protein BO87DRAFT_1506 [Aspergillus neoniger CBS 115656]